MARDDLFRRSFEAGTAFLDMTREKAEALVKDLVKAGEVKKGKASKLIEEVLERSRRGTEELVSLIRREIGEQVAALGLATKDDLARLEARLGGSGGEDEGGAAVPPVEEAVPGTAAPAPEAPGQPAAGEAQVTGARAAGTAKAAAKATKAAKAPRKKAAGGGAAAASTAATAENPAEPPAGNGGSSGG